MDRTKEIIRLLRETDLPYKDIAVQCNCTVGGVNYWAKRIKASNLDIKTRKRGRKALVITE